GVGQLPARHDPVQWLSLRVDALNDGPANLVVGIGWPALAVWLDHSAGIGEIRVRDVRAGEHRRLEPVTVSPVTGRTGEGHHDHVTATHDASTVPHGAAVAATIAAHHAPH